MPWYSYLFFILSFVCIFFGLAGQAQRRNTAGAIQAVVLALFWGALGAWTGGLLS